MNDHSTKEHSDFGGSVIGRVVNCPGSVASVKRCPEKASSSYADEGTFAHALGEKALDLGIRDAEDFLDDEIESPKIKSKKIVDKAMAGAVQVYLNAVYRELDKTPDALLQIEQRFTLPISTAEEGEVFGANDALVFHPSTGRLVIFDYKHGAGVSVDATDNDQLKFYAVGAVLSNPDWNVQEIECVIVQPRARDADEQEEFGVKPWPMDLFEVIEFTSVIEQAVERAKIVEAEASHLLPVDGETVQGVPVLNVGSWCRWCAAAAVCPAKAKDVVQSAGIDFHDIAGMDTSILPAPADMNIERVEQTVMALEKITQWAEQCRDFLFNAAMQGIPLKHFKLVDKIGRRGWIDNEQEIAGYLEAVYGVAQEDSFPRQIVSITEAERLVKAQVKDKAARKEALDDISLRFTLKNSSGQALAPITDRRDAVAAGPSADFAGVVL